MKLRDTAESVQVIAIGFVLGQADELSISELYQQRDVGFANCGAQLAATRELFSFG
jgi:hypothetical protein